MNCADNWSFHLASDENMVGFTTANQLRASVANSQQQAKPAALTLTTEPLLDRAR
jgi:hypothetical protein